MNVAVCLFFIAATFFAVFLSIVIKEETVKINTVVGNINDTLYELNRPKIGVISQIYHVTLDARLTLDNANKAAIDERLYLEKQQPIEMEKINGLLDRSSETLSSLQDSIAGIASRSDTVADNLNQTVEQSRKMLVQSTAAVSSAQKVISNPAIPEMFNNLNKTILSLHDTVNHSDAIVIDTQEWWHKFLHPSLGHKIWNLVTHTSETVAKFFW